MAVQDMKENLSVCCCFHIFPVRVFFFAFHWPQWNITNFAVAVVNVIGVSPYQCTEWITNFCDLSFICQLHICYMFSALLIRYKFVPDSDACSVSTGDNVYGVERRDVWKKCTFFILLARMQVVCFFVLLEVWCTLLFLNFSLSRTLFVICIESALVC
jgi:hypothetical protein